MEYGSDKQFTIRSRHTTKPPRGHADTNRPRLPRWLWRFRECRKYNTPEWWIISLVPLNNITTTITAITNNNKNNNRKKSKRNSLDKSNCSYRVGGCLGGGGEQSVGVSLTFFVHFTLYTYLFLAIFPNLGKNGKKFIVFRRARAWMCDTSGIRLNNLFLWQFGINGIWILPHVDYYR